MPVTRDRLEFRPTDEPLRRDVGRLGAIMGELIREQCGAAMFELVESVRRSAIAAREDGNGSLAAMPQPVEPGQERDLIRAFSTYFQAVNLAERVHRIRRSRDWARQSAGPQPGSLADAFGSLREHVRSASDLQAILDRIRIEPVFTAHPTEPTRRTILRKQQRIARRLVELMDSSLTPREQETAWDSIRAALTSTWQTEEHPTQRMTVRDEFEHVGFYLTEVLYRVIPVFYETLEEALSDCFGTLAPQLRLPVMLRFGSWVGGDMDGNPSVTAGTVCTTLAAQRAAILRLYESELADLAGRLTQSPVRVNIGEGMLARSEAYAALFPQALDSVPARHRNMPYRVFCHLLIARLAATRQDGAHPYAGADEFLADLDLIDISLAEHKGRHAGLFAVRRLIWRARTFGFHLASLDLRQDALVHRRVVGRGLGDPDWAARPASERSERLRRELSRPAPMPHDMDTEGQRTLAVFEAIGECRARYGGRSIGPYIISMAQSLDDVLSVLLLARWAGLSDADARVPLDVAPLFETLSDLENSVEILEGMLTDPVYGAHLQQRGDRQMVMIGYSDSNKDAGIAAARWALQQAEGGLAACARRRGVELTLFHGRGGTVSRGGSKTHEAVLAAPPGAVRGVLRVTEQGEIINAKYGLRGIALRTLERAVGSVAARSGMQHPPVEAAWTQAMSAIAHSSAAAYRALVRDDPGFYGFFRQATPIDVIERMKIGSRPASRRSGQGVQDLRAIPWVFAWTQNRSVLPGWYGLGTGLAAARAQYGAEVLQHMFRDWMFMRALLRDVEMVLAKTDMDMAARYVELVAPELRHFFVRIRSEFERTVELVLALKDTAALLEHDPVLQRTIRLRNPYVDPMSIMQIDLLRRWRASDCRDEELLEALLLTVNGIAHGLQNTG
jgi:phosphoenolpyruvate carboxylase